MEWIQCVYMEAACSAINASSLWTTVSLSHADNTTTVLSLRYNTQFTSQYQNRQIILVMYCCEPALWKPSFSPYCSGIMRNGNPNLTLNFTDRKVNEEISNILLGNQTNSISLSAIHRRPMFDKRTEWESCSCPIAFLQSFYVPSFKSLKNEWTALFWI